jgi:hypothetical protein
MSGRRPSIHAERFLAERMRIDISTFRSKSVSRALAEIGNVDLVLCFRAEAGRRAGPALSQSPVARFLSFPALAHGGERQSDIADPHGREPGNISRLFPTDR